MRIPGNAFRLAAVAILLLFSATAVASPDSDLIAAARRGDLSGISKALSAGARIGAKDAGGRTALHFAAAEGRIEAMRLLLKNRAPLEAKAQGGETALIFAASYLQGEAMTLLIGSGADVAPLRAYVNEPLGELWPLHEAASRGKAAEIRIFIHYGADPDLPCRLPQAYRPLHFAVFAASAPELAKAALAAARALIEEGAHPGAGDVAGKSALAYALENGSKEIAGYLLPYSDNPSDALLALRCGNRQAFETLYSRMKRPNALDAEGRGFVHYAVLAGDAALVKRFLAEGADGRLRDRRGDSPLRLALDKRDLTIIGLLIDSGADPEERYVGRDGSPLCLAAAKGDLDLMRFLMARGALPYASVLPDPLDSAVRGRQLEAAKLLLDAGAPAGGLRSSDGLTPLAISIMLGREGFDPALSELLIARGASVDEATASGLSPLAIARQMGTKAAEDFLLAHGARETAPAAIAPAAPSPEEEANEAFFQAVWRGDDAAVASFLDAGIAPNATIAGGRSALFYAARQDAAELCELLVARGAALELANGEGVTPLFAAVDAGALAAIRVLAAAGADLNAKDPGGLPAVAKAKAAGKGEVVALLLSLGAADADPPAAQPKQQRKPRK